MDSSETQLLTTSFLVVAQLGLIYSHAINTFQEVLSTNHKSWDDNAKKENNVLQGHLDPPPIRAANILIPKMDKHEFPALFVCEVRSLFLLIYTFRVIPHCSF